MDNPTETLAAQVARLEQSNATLHRILASERAERDALVQTAVERIAKEHARQWTGWLKRGESARVNLSALCRAVEPLARVVAAWPAMGGNVSTMPLMSAGGETITVGELQALVAIWKAARGGEASAELASAEARAIRAEASADTFKVSMLQLCDAAHLALAAGYEDHARREDPAPMPTWHQTLERACDHAGATCALEPGLPVASAVRGLVDAVQAAFRWRWQPGTRPPCAPSCKSWSTEGLGVDARASTCDCGLLRIAESMSALCALGVLPGTPDA